MTTHQQEKIKDSKLYLDYGVSTHVTRDARYLSNVKRMVDFAIVKSIARHTHKVYGKGNIIVA